MHRLLQKKNWTFLWTLWTLIVDILLILFWIVENSWKISKKKRVCLSLKATLNFFYVSYEIWWKTFTGDLILSLWRFKIILILNFGRNIGFSWNRKYFFSVSVFERIVGWLEIKTKIHPSCVTDCFGHTVRSNSVEEFTVPWICWRLLVASIFRLEFQIDEIKERKAWPAPIFCGWCLNLSVQMMFLIRVWFGEVKLSRKATRVPD